MQQGEIVEEASVRELFGAPQHAYTRRLLASGADDEDGPGIAFSIRTAGFRAAGIRPASVI